ncbi:MAG: class I SAM-dependent methyltransferase [Candidatus Saelkia tenebricola]|nr:class I SAM-dependent methyltransferase [Candidatus Saelkia tenebricola]
MESNLLKKTAAFYLQVFLIKMGWKRFWEGIYYSKMLEYQLVLKEFDFAKNCKVLDVGPGKSFLPFYWIFRGQEVWLVDNGQFYPDFDKYYHKVMKQKFSSLKEKISIIWGNFLEIDFPTNYFDIICAISTLEHFQSSDDIKAVMRLASLLKKGGKCIISLPFSQSGTKESILTADEGGYSYFQRDYDLSCVYARIIERAGLKLKYFTIIGERLPCLGKIFFFQKPLSNFKPFWTIFLTSLFWKVYYKGKTKEVKQFKYPGVIILVLEK